jgi:hypothetical protein
VTRAVLVLLALLASCAPRTISSPEPHAGATPARIDVTRVLASPPFAALLAQYDADLAALRRSAKDPAFAGTDAAVGASAADVARRLDAGAQQLRGLHAEPIALPKSVAEPRHDFGDTVEPFRRAASARAERATALRAAQMREHEATIAYDFERAHGGQRLLLELKLRDLHLDAATRQRNRAELAALDAREAALVSAARARDDAELASYRAQRQTQALAESASMAADVASHARAARTISLQTNSALPWVPRWSDGDGANTIARFAAARADLTSRLLAVRNADDAGRSSVNEEIAGLQRDRDALRAQIVASAQARAAKIAAARRLGRVYTSGAPAGARDLTEAVLQSYSVSTGS